MDATNNFVLDGSVTMMWGLEDEADEYAEAILERMPDLPSIPELRFFLLERNRFAVGKTAISLISPRPQQLTPSDRLDPSLEPTRSAVLISALATHSGRLGPFLAA